AGGRGGPLVLPEQAFPGRAGPTAMRRPVVSARSCLGPPAPTRPRSFGAGGEHASDPPDECRGALAAFGTSLKLDRHRHELHVRDVCTLSPLASRKASIAAAPVPLFPSANGVAPDDVDGVRRGELVEPLIIGFLHRLHRGIDLLEARA